MVSSGTLRRWMPLPAIALAVLIPLNAVGQPTLPDLPELMRQIPFSIREVVIEGNSLVPTEDLSDAVSAYLGDRRRIDDLEAIRLSIIEAYRVRGHELLSVIYDPNRSTAGRHFFVVLEVELGKVTVSGA
jgi:hemolysin activation/secretion protein